jgi:protoheme IX farnesyltransferase
MSGIVYLAGVSVLNLGFLWYALRMMISKDILLPMYTFAFSITYLMVLFLFLLVDHYVNLML